MVKRHPKDMPELMRLVIGSTPGEFKDIKEAVLNISKTERCISRLCGTEDRTNGCTPLKRRG